MKYFPITFLFILFLLTCANTVEACSCMGRPQGVKGVQTCGYYWGSENIFVGLAEKVEIEKYQMKVTFSVERSIRGINEKTVEVFTSASTASCGYPFKQGERYFVYGHKGSDGKYRESLCGPTTSLEYADDDLEYARDIDEGKLGTRIFGGVFEDWQPTVKDKRRSVPLPGIEVTITNNKDTFSTLTDEKGTYLFKDIPKSTYRVFAKLPKGYRELFVRQDLTEHFAGSCSAESFRVTRQGSLRGKVVKFPSRAIRNPWNRDEVQQPKVSLVPLGENDQVNPNDYYEEKWAYRDKFEYYFDFVPAGQYLLAMNPGNCPYPNNGVPPTFFPGVADQAKAKIITVKEGENLVLEDFRSLSLLKERWFSGMVLNTDKTPAANVTVQLRDAEFPRCANLNVETKSDELGRFQLKGFESYKYKITACSEKTQSQRRSCANPFSVAQDGGVSDIQLILDQSY